MTRPLRRYVKGKLANQPSGAPKMTWGYRGADDGQVRPRTRVSSSVVFHEHPENVHIADNVFVWHWSILDGSDHLTIEEGVQVGGWVGLFTHSSHVAIRLMGDRYAHWEGERPGWQKKPLIIGAYSFIGAKSSVLPGANIGRAVVVSAGSLVMKPVRDFAVVAGTPARVVGDVRDIDADHIAEGDEFWADYQRVLGPSGIRQPGTK